MLWTVGEIMNKGISIITNWGCPEKCWYCIWEFHPLKNTQLQTDWNKLESFIKEHQSLKKFSISGGGDCLFRYNEHLDWWNKIFDLAYKYNMKIDVHSRTKFYDVNFWKKINKVVISCDNLNVDKHYLRLINKFCTVRIVKVITSRTSIHEANNFIRFAKKYKMQLTFKQLSVFQDANNYTIIKNKFKNESYFLDSGDYNLYFMPNNEIWDKFI